VIDFYCGINETKWNHHPVLPGPLSCVAPVYGKSAATKRVNSVRLPKDTKVINDSSAFSDGPDDRLEFSAALDRQVSHSEKYDFSWQVTHRASYDLLIDEKWEGGQRSKRRWSENDAWEAVKVTIEAAKYMALNYHYPRIQSAQGVTASQYLECTIRIMEWFDTKRDIFGLGGWCISGVMPRQLRPAFNATMQKVIPFLARAEVKQVHIWGVIDPTFLGPLLWMCDQHDLKLSTDSAGPSKRPAFGEWGYRGWRDLNYKRVPTCDRGLERARHVEATRQWLKNLRATEFYHHPDWLDGKKNTNTLFEVSQCLPYS
jgi:hypothetical protein